MDTKASALSHMSEVEAQPGARLLSRSRHYVLFERRFYSDDPLACAEFAAAPDWWEFVISLRPPDPAVLTCPRTRMSEQRWLHHHLVIQIKPETLRDWLLPDADKVIAELRGFVRAEVAAPERVTLAAHASALCVLVDQMLTPPSVGSLRLFYEAKVRELVSHLCFERPEIQVAQEEERLRQAMDYLQTHLSDPYALQGASDCLGVSSRQCQRLFRVAVGCSPSAYLTELRLRRAAYLLAHNAMSVSEIALEVGYLNLSHFAKAFRQRFGQPPSQFRRAPHPVWDAADSQKL
ncbi:MAG: helix-turn-helix transcriptional regulator [Fimbriimonadia bacterium]|nr:helix-turn-helix transcriptional regulator [Fimbriimonadia bacterium]